MKNLIAGFQTGIEADGNGNWEVQGRETHYDAKRNLVILVLRNQGQGPHDNHAEVLIFENTKEAAIGAMTAWLVEKNELADFLEALEESEDVVALAAFKHATI